MIPRRTLDRILDGAMAAVERHGLAKLEMRDVSTSARVSRGTVYRYFSNRDVLLAHLAKREGQRFQQQMLAAIENAPPGPERILVALEQVTRDLRRHRALQRLLETDPAFVLRALRAELPRIKRELGAFLAPLLEQTHPVQHGVVSAEQLVDWMLRLMVSTYLLPEAAEDDMAHGLTAVYRTMTAPISQPAPKQKKSVGTRRRRVGSVNHAGRGGRRSARAKEQ